MILDHVHTDSEEIMGDEDCLYLNVFTPRLPAGQTRGRSSPTLLPVIVFLHDGAFIKGSGEVDPSPLVKQGLVVVTLNHRLGALGFFSLSTPIVAGNQGLKDQLEALRWTNVNIRAFGGDPSRVTLLGSGAGSYAAHLHQMSPAGAGLYSGVIAMGVHPLRHSVQMSIRVPERNSERLVRELDCDLPSLQSVLDCMGKKETNELIEKTDTNLAKMMDFVANAEEEKNGTGPFRFTPNVDSFSVTPFLPQHPLTIIKVWDVLEPLLRLT